MSPEEQDAQIQQILVRGTPGTAFQFADSWERRKEQVLVVFVAEENIYREVIYEAPRKGRQLRIRQGDSTVHTETLQDDQTQIYFPKAGSNHSLVLSLQSPVLYSNSCGPRIASFATPNTLPNIDIAGKDFTLDLSSENRSLLVFGRLRPDIGSGLDIFSFLKLFNPSEAAELEAALSSRPALEEWGRLRLQEMRALFPKKKSAMKISLWREDF
jgi:hypothetical protein